MYRIQLAVSVQRDLEEIPPFQRARILDAMAQQLVYQPLVPTRNRKVLVNLRPPWDAVPPIWELRIGEFRVFYDVEEPIRTVFIRAIRHKPPGRTTEEIL